VARSAKPAFTALGAGVVAVGLAGCVTTQEKNSWLLLRNARTLAEQIAVRVTTENPLVRVKGIEIVRGRRADALVVSVANLGPQPLTDLPISIGVIAHRAAPVYLNGRANIDYYDTHVPAIPAHATTSWVLPGIRTVPAGRLFARVGVARDPSSTTVAALPRIGAGQLTGTSADRLRVRLSNDSSLPQYTVQVYAVAVRHGTAVGAGRTALFELSGGSQATVGLTLAGRETGAELELYAPPTIFK
jgi:hypothetical protein